MHRVALLCLLLAACATTTDMTTMPAMDGDVAGILLTANEGEAQQGSAAATRATSADVRAFAQMMASDHTAGATAVRDAASRAGITPAENDTTRALRTGSQQAITNLATWSGAEFDRRYMQSQVDLHQWLLSVIDSHLLPGTRSPELRAVVQTQRASVAAHLERARQIAGAL